MLVKGDLVYDTLKDVQLLDSRLLESFGATDHISY